MGEYKDVQEEVVHLKVHGKNNEEVFREISRRYRDGNSMGVLRSQTLDLHNTDEVDEEKKMALKILKMGRG